MTHLADPARPFWCGGGVGTASRCRLSHARICPEAGVPSSASEPKHAIRIMTPCRVLKMACQPHYRWLAILVIGAGLTAAYGRSLVRRRRGKPGSRVRVAGEPTSLRTAVRRRRRHNP